MMYELTSNTQSLATIEDYLEAIKKRKWIVVASIIASLAIAYLATSSRTETYNANATVIVNPTPVASIDGRLVAPKLEREVQVIVGNQVAAAAVEILNTDEDPLELSSQVKAQFVPKSDAIRIEYTANSPARAAAVPNAFLTAYVQQRTDAQNRFYNEQITLLQEESEQQSANRNTFSQQVIKLDADRQSTLTTPVSLARTAQLETIASARLVAVNEQNAIIGRLRIITNELSDLEAARKSQIPAAQTLSQALEPTSPQGLGKTIITMAALLFGTLFGVLAAFLAHRLDSSASTGEDVTQSLQTQVVGSVPDLGWRQRRAQNSLVMLATQKTVKIYQARESYRRLRTSIEFLMRSNNLRTMIITSSHPGEGKSTTAANLAVALSSSGVSVVLINADLRRPSLEKLFNASNTKPGLAGYLGRTTETCDFERFDELPNLVLVPAGPAAANPGELLGSDRFKDLLANFSKQADIVIVDTPPLGATADAAAASKAVDGVLMVVDVEATSTQDLRIAKSDLDQAGANLLGAVLNRDSTRDSGMFQKRNRYAYSRAD